MSPGHEDAHGHRSSRSWLIAGLIFAVMATAVLVLSSDARWLRLGIVAALWAALLGAFLATHYRRQADRINDSMADAQEVYELELEREIAARREYELEIEADARRRAADTSRAEIDALRTEVATLRTTLEKLFGGEVLYERVALTAQSTRMRSFPEEPPPQKSITAGREPRNGDRPPVVQAPASRSYDKLAEQRTELIARVLDPEPARRDRNPPPRREPEPRSWFTQPETPAAREPEPPKPPEPPEPPASPSHPADSGDLSTALSGGFDHGWPSLEPTWEELSRPKPEPAAEPVNGTSPPVNRTLPADAQEIQRTSTGGRRRKPDPEPEPEQPRARHYKPDPEPEPPPPVETGSHASGRSVSELLAAYGESQPRRRRRRDD